jgi:hypothetical protein
VWKATQLAAYAVPLRNYGRRKLGYPSRYGADDGDRCPEKLAPNLWQDRDAVGQRRHATDCFMHSGTLDLEDIERLG